MSAVLKRTVITFPLFDCVGIDTLNLSRLSAKSRETGFSECGPNRNLLAFGTKKRALAARRDGKLDGNELLTVAYLDG